MDIPILNLSKSDPLYKVSNPIEVQKKAYKLYGKKFIVYKSDKTDKKYKIKTPTGKLVYFGDATMEDYTKYLDLKRRNAYLARATHIKGDWEKNIYSPNFLAIHLLW